jgi:L-ribulokinase
MGISSAAAEPAYAIGLGYGTNSVRAVVVHCADGRSVGSQVFSYPSGEQGSCSMPRTPSSLVRTRPTTWRACARR